MHWNCNEVIWWVLVILWFSKAINMNIMCLYFRDLGSVNNLWKCWVKFHSSWKREWNFIEISLKFHCNLINEISLMKFQFHSYKPAKRPHHTVRWEGVSHSQSVSGQRQYEVSEKACSVLVPELGTRNFNLF